MMHSSPEWQHDTKKLSEELIELASELVSQITHFAGVVMLPGERRSQFRQIEFLQLADDRILAILVTDDGRVSVSRTAE